MSHTENRWQGNPYRQEYLDGINNYIKTLRKKADETRNEYTKNILTNGDFYREEFKKMLGVPLSEAFDENDIPKIKKTFVANDDGISIYRMQIEVIPDLWMYGIYFVREDGAKRPFVVCQHGGMGTSEICSSFFDSSNYNNMVKRVLVYGVNVFAPQLLLWHSATYGIDYDRRSIDISLKQAGSSITAVEVYGIRRCINYFSAQKENDKDKIAMVGLSYGGFYTLFTTACEKRIRAAFSCSFYNNRYTHNWSDWMWDSSAEKFFDAEIAMLIYPRKLTIAVGKDDELFKVHEARKEFERLKSIIGENDKWVEFFDFEGIHEFIPQEEPLKNFMEKFLG